ncbi:DNA alkylation repair protein [Mongoliibacter ruber]|uniref:3-methyladenine DNA glycosylase AlkD n=1 Tax=Mongoliibacter ruber TaxID=1750599 RepID=A0A2T0WR48_9BACT|nr:DNA alkylation repair protein [Mongoliibacter ruber]PRY89147.1 3-methyladenine DNA glycosylase AlkD [Mongoliibacter ruber]
MTLLSDIIILEIQGFSDPSKVVFHQKFFKTGIGEYGEGDQFLGVKVPELRQITKKYWKDITAFEIKKLLDSPYHEVRLAGIFILVQKYEKSKNEKEKEAWVDFYLDNKSAVNNWDLVDSSAPRILGAWLHDKPKDLLYDLARSGKLWDQRIAMLSTFYFIRNHHFEDALAIAEILIQHSEDLIQKAVGWMIREVANRDLKTGVDFLELHWKKMPRTMLRYAIEKFDEELRQEFLKRK